MEYAAAITTAPAHSRFMSVRCNSNTGTTAIVNHTGGGVPAQAAILITTTPSNEPAMSQR